MGRAFHHVQEKWGREPQRQREIQIQHSKVIGPVVPGEGGRGWHSWVSHLPSGVCTSLQSNGSKRSGGGCSAHPPSPDHWRRLQGQRWKDPEKGFLVQGEKLHGQARNCLLGNRKERENDAPTPRWPQWAVGRWGGARSTCALTATGLTGGEWRTLPSTPHWIPWATGTGAALTGGKGSETERRSCV